MAGPGGHCGGERRWAGEGGQRGAGEAVPRSSPGWVPKGGLAPFCSESYNITKLFLVRLIGLCSIYHSGSDHRQLVSNTYNTRSGLRMEGNRLKQQTPTKSGVITSLKGYITNFSFGFQGLFSHTARPTRQDLIYLAGQQCSSLEQAQSLQRQLPWFTYCKHTFISNGFSSDVGWGCMVRVAQMALAAAILRFSEARGLDLDRACVIGAFLSEGKYSLTQFLEQGKTLFLKQPGAWFSVTEAALLLECLHCSRPLRGSEQLKVMTACHTFSLPQARRLLVQDLKIQFRKEKKEMKEKRSGRALLLIVSVQLGTVTEESYRWVLQILTWPWTLGCLGGKPKQARFLTGRCNQEVSYLDPHYVQEEVGRLDLQHRLDRYSCNQYRLMNRFDLDPSLAFCFFLDSIEDLLALAKKIEEGKSPLGVSQEEEREEKSVACLQATEEEGGRPSMECSFFMD